MSAGHLKPGGRDGVTPDSLLLPAVFIHHLLLLFCPSLSGQQTGEWRDSPKTGRGPGAAAATWERRVTVSVTSCEWATEVQAGPGERRRGGQELARDGRLEAGGATPTLPMSGRGL